MEPHRQHHLKINFVYPNEVNETLVYWYKYDRYVKITDAT